MPAASPHIRTELPWLRSGSLYRVHRSATAALDDLLNRFSYHRVTLDGRRMTSRLETHAELARAFRFPDYYGMNWDAFDDCFGESFDFEEDRLAIVWDHVEAAAATAPVTAIELGWILLDW